MTNSGTPVICGIGNLCVDLPQTGELRERAAEKNVRRGIAKEHLYRGTAVRRAITRSEDLHYRSTLGGIRRGVYGVVLVLDCARL